MVIKCLIPIGLIVLSRIQSVQGLLQQGLSLTDSRRIIAHGGLLTQFHRNIIITPTTVLKVSSTSPNFQRRDASSSDNNDNGESEAERLLRLARKLRQQAEEEEHNVHEHLYQKKRKEDEQLDQWIQNLCLTEATSSSTKKNVHIVNQLKDRKPCMETLERIVDRLHEHHLIASGHECVEAPAVASSKKETQHHVQRVHHQKDDVQVQKIELQAEALFEAIDIVDDELHHDHRSDHSDAESRHWGGDQRANELRNRWHSLLREHEEQFLKRQASFIEAQTIKKDNPTPPKVQDDHGLLP